MVRTRLVLPVLLVAVGCGDPATSGLYEPSAKGGSSASGGRTASGGGDGEAGEGGSARGTQGDGGADSGGGGEPQAGSGGSGSGGDDGNQAGSDGMGGTSTAGTGGKGGEAGSGGSGGKPTNCDEHFAAVNQALLAAQACNPETDIPHCTGTVQDLCGCPQPVEHQESEATRKYEASVKAAQDAGCILFCAAILCVAPGPASCQAIGDSGRCTAIAFDL